MAWINANAGLPDDDTIVLGFMPASIEPVWLVYYEADQWYDVDGAMRVVTHWQYLPEAPQCAG